MTMATAGEYRLDVVTDPEPDDPQAVHYFAALDLDAACRTAAWLLADVDGPDDRYGELYADNGTGSAIHCDTIHLPA
jgi:hypothetical protein